IKLQWLIDYTFFFQAEDGIRDRNVTGVQTCALPILKAVQEMQKSNVEELNQINNEISTSMTNIKRNLNETVKKAEQETRDLVSNAKHGALVTNIIDALKYGAATSAITIPVLYFL